MAPDPWEQAHSNNPGMQRTALRTRKIVAFLNAGIDQALSRSIGAPPLMPKPLSRPRPVVGCPLRLGGRPNLALKQKTGTRSGLRATALVSA